MSSDRYHKAAKDGMLDVLREANKREVNAKDEYGRTPVLWAAFEGRLDALRLLVGRGGDPDKSDQFGNSGLHLAAAKGHIRCVDFLVKFGVNLFALDIDRHTAKDLAAINNRDDILRYLDAATAHLELVDKKKCKQFKELADKQCEKRIGQYAKRQQKLEKSLEAEYQQTHSAMGGLPMAAAAAGTANGYQTQSRSSAGSVLGEWKHRLWSASQGNLKQAVAPTSSVAQPAAMQSTSGTKFSALVGGTLGGMRGGTVQRRVMATKQARSGSMPMAAGDFKVGEFEAGSGKRSVRSLQGVQRNSEVLYVGTFSNNGDPLKRGKITDVFGVLEETAETTSDTEMNGGSSGGGGMRGGSTSAGRRMQLMGSMVQRQQSIGSSGTMSRSYSQPDFMQQQQDEDQDETEAISEEVMMQRPAGLFDRPMLGSLAFRRSVSAALSELQPDTSSVGSSNNSSHKSTGLQNLMRSHLVISDSDTEGAGSTDGDDDDDDDDENGRQSGYTSLGRFLTAWGLEEHMHIFEKQQIDLDTLMLLTESDLKSLNLPLGPFRKLAIAVQERKNALTSPGAISDSRL